MLREDDHPAQASEGSERSRLDPFVVATGDAPPRDQRDLMERPFFSLAKTPRTKPILYKAADIEVQVFGMPEHGMATIWDADVLIWAASQIVAAENSGLTTSRFFRFTPYHLLRAIGRPTGNRQYLLLKAALERLQSTVIATTMRVQAGAVGNIDSNRAEMAALVGQSQGATGALQATQAGNQLLALQSQQLSDLIAVISANGRANALSEAERATAAEQGRIQRERFLTPGVGYQPGNAQMFNNGNN